MQPEEVIVERLQAANVKEAIGQQNSRNSKNSSPSSKSLFCGPTEPLGPKPEQADSFPLDQMGPLTSVTQLLAKDVQCPEGLAAQSILAAVSLSAQQIADVRNPLSGRVVPVSCFFLSVALSGERKSSVDGLCLDPIVEYERSKFEAYWDEQKSYEDQKFLYDQNRRQAMKSDNPTQELELLSPPDKPINPMMLMPEPTIEAVEKHEGSSIGIFSDEGGRLFGGYAMNADNRKKTIAGLSSLWDGKPIRRARASDETFVKYDTRLSLHLMMQPNIASEVLSDRLLIEQGFLARCLVSQPESTMGTRFIRVIREPVDNHPCYLAYRNRLSAMLTRDEERAVLEPSTDAKEILREFYNHVEERLGVGGELHQVSGFAAKTAEHSLRLGALLAVYRSESSISTEHMSCGIELAQYYLGEAIRLFGSPGESQAVKDARLLLRWIKEKNHHVIHPVLIYQKGPGRLQNDREAVQAAARELVKHGYLREEKDLLVDGSVRKRAWSVNEQIYEVSE